MIDRSSQLLHNSSCQSFRMLIWQKLCLSGDYNVLFSGSSEEQYSPHLHKDIQAIHDILFAFRKKVVHFLKKIYNIVGYLSSYAHTLGMNNFAVFIPVAISVGFRPIWRNMNIIICEDEQLYQKSICQKIDEWKKQTNYLGIEVLCYTSSEDFLEQWRRGISADILFLDILFGHELDGMSVARYIRESDQSVPIVFITNSDAYVKDGYAVRAFRYLNKPVSYGDIAQCLDVAYKQYTIAHNEYLILSNVGRRLAIRYEDILYVEAQSPYVLIHMCKQSVPIKIRCRFSDFVLRLPEEPFVLCHRSYVVNIVHVRRIKRNELMLSSGEVLPISRPYLSDIYTAFDSYYQEGSVFVHVDSI